MAYSRGDVVEITFILPYNDGQKTHPVIIISNEEVYNADGMYIGVMITHMVQEDIFTFKLNEEMFVNPTDGKPAQARCHLITNFTDQEIIINKNRNKMKRKFVDRLVTRITSESFSALD